MGRTKRKRRRKNGRNRQQQKRSKNEQNAEILADNGDFEAARNLLVAKASLTDQERRLLASSHFRLGEFEQASDVIAAIESKMVYDYENHGLYLVSAKRWTQAEAALRLALSLDNKSAWTYYLLARALAKESVYSLDVEVRTEVQNLLIEACYLPDSIPDAFLYLERFYYRESEGDERLSLLRHGLKQHPNRVDIRYRLVHQLVFHSREYDIANEVIAPLLIADEIHGEYLWAAFQIEYGRGNFSGAMEWVDKLLEYHRSSNGEPYTAGLHQVRGELLIHLGRPSEAAECFLLEINTKEQINQVLPVFGLAILALYYGDINQATMNIELGIEQWADQFRNRMLPGEYEYIGDYEHQFDTCKQLRERLESVALQPPFTKLVAQIDYLIDRTHKSHLPLNRLRPIAKMLKHPILDYDFSITYGEQKRWTEAVGHHLQLCFVLFQRDDLYFNDFFYEKHIDFHFGDTHLMIHQTIVSFLNGNEKRKNASFIESYILPLYSEFWRQVLFDGKLWYEVIEVIFFLEATCPNNDETQFDKAYCLDMTGQRQDAIAVYRDLIEKQPENTSAIHNLSILIEDDDPQEAVVLAQRAFQLAPEDDYCKRRWQSVQNIEERRAEAEAQRAEEAARQDEFLRTARERFPQLDFHKRRILSTLTVISYFDDLDHLADLSGTGRQYITGNWRKLVEMGMIVEDESGEPIINEYILDLVQQERSHSVATTLIRADDRIAFKPVFNSKLEYSVYNIMIGLFPNHLVFPNMSLQTVFQYKKIKELVDADTFHYYLMSQVDICITSTSSYLPIIAFEIDSHYHDGEDQQKRDRKKNQLFQVGGVPLLRLRAYGQPTDATIRNDIIKAVREIGHELRHTHSESHGILKLTLELDFDNFGGPMIKNEENTNDDF
ncbi:DUF2726 domain-containing protein [Gimesia maris]|uniref:DUF2726 domain-containing protein n=1 Tax=Gimesia maris TaxID=122 RepID=UPI003A959B81